jgi:hypothetical protein
LPVPPLLLLVPPEDVLEVPPEVLEVPEVAPLPVPPLPPVLELAPAPESRPPSLSSSLQAYKAEPMAS